MQRRRRPLARLPSTAGEWAGSCTAVRWRCPTCSSSLRGRRAAEPASQRALSWPCWQHTCGAPAHRNSPALPCKPSCPFNERSCGVCWTAALHSSARIPRTLDTTVPTVPTHLACSQCRGAAGRAGEWAAGHRLRPPVGAHRVCTGQHSVGTTGRSNAAAMCRPASIAIRRVRSATRTAPVHVGTQLGLSNG